MSVKVQSATHPDYDANTSAWQIYRDILAGGKKFVDAHLIRFSKREDMEEFYSRKLISYNPAHAEAVLIEIKNAIYQRMADITRSGGPDNFKEAIEGRAQGVDLHGNSMTDFMGEDVILELLAMGRVGVYIDKHAMPQNATRAETMELRPYLYVYRAEDIRAWRYDKGRLVALLLREVEDKVDETTGLTVGEETIYRLLTTTEKGIQVQLYDRKGVLTETTILQLKEIPFVLGQLSHSLLKNIDGYQIALLNLASSDLSYALKSNFTFYTEQFDFATEWPHLRNALEKETAEGTEPTKDGSAGEASKTAADEIDLGAVSGRRYAKGTERPGFISPSTDPLKASMEKQSELRTEIRMIANLNLSNLRPVRESEGAKKFNERTLEAGLSYIGLELQYIERQVGIHWCAYEDVDNDIVVKYPLDYSLKTDSERRAEAKEIVTEAPKISSITYQREAAKLIARLFLGNKVSNETAEQIELEITKAIVPIANPETISKDVESGFLSLETAAKLRLYPEGEADNAMEDMAEKTAQILAAQKNAAQLSKGESDPEDPERAKGAPALEEPE